MTALLDTNVAMYAAGRDHPARGPSKALLRRIATGDMDVVADAEVFQEILHRFSAIGRIEDGCRLFDLLERIVQIVLPIELEDARTARQIILDIRGLTARDAIHVAVMRRHSLRIVYSYDRHLDAVPGIERREP